LFQDVFSVIEPANAVLERHAIITYAANVFMAPSWWLTFEFSGARLFARPLERFVSCVITATNLAGWTFHF
jgi:hypothetical protein